MYVDAVLAQPRSLRIPRPEVGPMTLLSVLVSTDETFILSLLTFTATLSLERPHSSCMDARPEAHAGMKDLDPFTHAAVPSPPPSDAFTEQVYTRLTTKY